MIDYSALQKLDNYSLAEGYRYQKTLDSKTQLLVYKAIIIISIVLLGLVAFYLLKQGLEQLPPLVFMFIVYIALFVAMNASYASRGVQNLQNLWMDKFAKDNNFIFTTNLSTGIQTGILFARGQNKRAQNGISGTYLGKSFILFAYSYTTGSGKNKRTNTHGVLRVRLDKLYPHIMLDNKKDSSVDSIEFKDEQLLELEGDFNKTFNVFAPKEYEIEVLQILNPHVMQELLKAPEPVDIEFVGNDLYIYNIGSNTRQSIESIFRAFELLEGSTKSVQKTFTMAENIGTNTPTLKRSKKGVLLGFVMFIVFYIIATIIENVF